MINGRRGPKQRQSAVVISEQEQLHLYAVYLADGQEE